MNIRKLLNLVNETTLTLVDKLEKHSESILIVRHLTISISHNKLSILASY